MQPVENMPVRYKVSETNGSMACLNLITVIRVYGQNRVNPARPINTPSHKLQCNLTLRLNQNCMPRSNFNAVQIMLPIYKEIPPY